MDVEEFLKSISASGLGFEQILILVLLAYIFKVQFEQQKQRIWATLEREQRVLMIEEIRKRVRHAEAMVEALCIRLGMDTGGAGGEHLGLPGDNPSCSGADGPGRGASDSAPAPKALRLLRNLRAARAGGLDELAEMCKPNDRHHGEGGEIH